MNHFMLVLGVMKATKEQIANLEGIDFGIT
jgi:hypothetical protein